MPASARTRRVVAMTKNHQNPAYSGARTVADRVAARFGCALTDAVPERPDDVDEQHRLLKAVHAERPDAVLIAPAHATRRWRWALTTYVRREPIPIVGINATPEGWWRSRRGSSWPRLCLTP